MLKAFSGIVVLGVGGWIAVHEQSFPERLLESDGMHRQLHFVGGGVQEDIGDEIGRSGKTMKR